MNYDLWDLNDGDSFITDPVLRAERDQFLREMEWHVPASVVVGVIVWRALVIGARMALSACRAFIRRRLVRRVVPTVATDRVRQ